MLGSDFRVLRSHRRAAFHRRHGQIRADPAAHLAAGCDGRPDASLCADPCGNDGDRRRVPDGAHVAAARIRAQVRCTSLPLSAPPPASSRLRSAACRTTSSASLRIPPVRSSATCSWPRVSVPTRPAFSTSSRTLSSRRCYSYAPAASSTPCRTSRTCARWAASGSKIPITYVCMWLGSLALGGIPYFAGYWSKDAILESTYAAHSAVGNLRLHVLGTIGGIPHRLLFLAPAVHDLPRQAARRRITRWNTCTKAPSPCGVRWSLLSVGAVFAGWLLPRAVHRRPQCRLLARRHLQWPEQPRAGLRSSARRS